MRAIHLDFQRAHRPVPWLGVGLMLAALIGLAIMAGYSLRLNEEMRFWERKADQASRLAGRHAPAAPISEQAARAQLLEAREANQVVRQLGLRWNALFAAVESAARPEVALLSLDPDLQNGTVKIGGEAKDFDALLSYVKDLSRRDAFGSVMLQNHQIQREIAEKPVRFSLVAQWRGAAP